VVIWGPGEREIGEAIVAESEGAALLSPQTTIADVIAIARGADVMVSGDTGPTHLAAAVATPIVGIYGPTSPGRNGPWSPDDVTVSRSEICECPHLRRCVGAHWCLLDLPVEEVLEGVERRLTVARRT
jgi:ADP-heptose:LPS heptosyltransferase